ncbi:hypothetical protein B2J96_04425 [Mycobacterium shigaense]|nr:hypothetical protein B2J96_04425 [Mycobacterium shigaense]
MSTLVTAAGLAAWFGTGVVHADSARDREACALMDDYAGSMHVGLTPVDYAMRALSKEMPPLDAAHAIADGARNDCPRHIGDLPDGWR